MRLLLDTHVVVWATGASSRLSPRARALIGDPDNDRFVSAATAYEIDHKRSRDRALALLPEDLEGMRARLVFDWLPIETSHASRAARLARHHGDPWDRVIVGQALSENLTIVSADRQLAAYGAPILW